MVRLTVNSLVILLIILACSDAPHQSGEDAVMELQEKSRSAPGDSVPIYLKEAEALLKSISSTSDSLWAENNFLMGEYYFSTGKTDSAATYFFNATKFVKDSATTERQGSYFEKAFSAYEAHGKFGDCLILANRFESLIDPETNSKSLSWAYYWQKSSNVYLGNYEEVLEIDKKQLALAKKRDTSNLPYAFTALAQTKYYYLNDKAGAYAIFDSLLQNEKELSANFRRQINGNYGVYQYFDGNFENALSYYLKASSAAKADSASPSYVNNLANTYNNIAEVYIDLGRYDKARKYLDSVRMLGISNLEAQKQQSLLKYELRLAIETGTGSNNITAVWDSLRVVQDRVYSMKIATEIEELKIANEKEKELLEANQVVELENLQLQNTVIIVLLSSISLIFIGFLLFQRRRLRFERASLLNQQRLLRTQMNPHYTSNALYAIQRSIAKDPKGASKQLLQFSRQLRGVLENSLKNYVPLDRELAVLTEYLELQKKRLPIDLTYELELKGLEADDPIFVPPMLIQPFVENSIEHGFAGIKRPGHIRISITRVKRVLQCEVEDNGKGFFIDNQNNKTSASTSLISDFIYKTTKTRVKISNIKNSIGNGTIVTFAIPYKDSDDH